MTIAEQYDQYKKDGGVFSFTDFADLTDQLELARQRFAFHSKMRGEYFTLFNTTIVTLTLVAHADRGLFRFDYNAGHQDAIQAFQELFQRFCEYHASEAIKASLLVSDLTNRLETSIYPTSAR